MRILNAEQQISKQGQQVEGSILDLEKLRADLADQLSEAKAFYFFNGHKIETIILKINAISQAIDNLKEYQVLINTYRKLI